MKNNKYIKQIDTLNNKIEEMYVDNENMFNQYQDYFSKFNIANELLRKTKNDLINLERDKKEWTTYLNNNGFKDLKDLTNFITKSKYCKCKCNCLPILDKIKVNDKLDSNSIFKKPLITHNIENKIPVNTNIPIVHNVNEYRTIENVDKNNLEIPLLTPSNSTENENISARTSDPKKKILKRHRNNSLKVMERYPVKIYNKTNSEILQFVSEENKIKIYYQYKISEKLNKNVEDIKINDIIDFKIKYEGLKDNKDQRRRLKYKIERCKILYENYGEKLSRFKISLSYISDMTEKIWNEWLQEFDNIVNELYKDKTKCEYKYNNNKLCGKYDCNIKHNLKT